MYFVYVHPVITVADQPKCNTASFYDQTLRKRRKLDEGDGACGLCMEEILDMGYFWKCLGEGFKDEGLKYTGLASRDDDSENSVVENNLTSSSEEERTTYSF